MRSSLVFLGSVLVVVFSSTANAQCKDRVVGNLETCIRHSHN
jgi:hypothetical protein